MNEQKILLVDDEEELRRSTAQALELSGFTVETFSNADHVLELIGYSFPRVVVSDIRMPGMDGMTLMHKIREIDTEVPVILVTGHGDVQLAVKARGAVAPEDGVWAHLQYEGGVHRVQRVPVT